MLSVANSFGQNKDGDSTFRSPLTPPRINRTINKETTYAR